MRTHIIPNTHFTPTEGVSNASSTAGTKSSKGVFAAGPGQAYARVTSLFAQIKGSILVKCHSIYIHLFIKDAGSFEKAQYFHNLQEKNAKLYDELVPPQLAKKTVWTVLANSTPIARTVVDSIYIQMEREQNALKQAIIDEKIDVKDMASPLSKGFQPYYTLVQNMARLMANLAKYNTRPAELDKFLTNTNNIRVIAKLCQVFGQDYVLDIIKEARLYSYVSIPEKKNLLADEVRNHKNLDRISADKSLDRISGDQAFAGRLAKLAQACQDIGQPINEADTENALKNLEKEEDRAALKDAFTRWVMEPADSTKSEDRG